MKNFALKFCSIFMKKTRYTKLPVALILIVLAFSVSTVAAQDFYPLEGKTFEHKEDKNNSIIYKFKKDGKFEYTIKGCDDGISVKWIYLGTYSQNDDEINFLVSDMKFKIYGINLSKLMAGSDKDELNQTMKEWGEIISGKYEFKKDGFVFDQMEFLQK